MVAIVNVLILLAVLIVAIWLQIFLSGKENRWLGLILPLLSFSISLLMVFGLAIFDGMTRWDVFRLVASTFLLANIPTVILVAIYLACREKRKRRKELEKMNVQDLN